MVLSAMSGVAFGLFAFAVILFGLCGSTWIEGYVVGVVVVALVWSSGILGAKYSGVQFGKLRLADASHRPWHFACCVLSVAFSKALLWLANFAGRS